MNIYFSKSSCDISMIDVSELKIVNVQDYGFYVVISPKNGVVIDFEDCKVKVKEGDLLYIRDYKICKSNKLDKFIRTNIEKQVLKNKSYDGCFERACESKSIN